MKGSINMKMVKYELVRRNTNDEIPHMRITTIDDNGKTEVGYLCPFRGYCFQISSGIDGGSDLASTITMNLAALIRGAALPYDGSKIVLEMIDLTISRYLGYSAGSYNSYGSNFDTLLQFAHDAMNWLVHNRADELGLKDYYPLENRKVIYCDR